ncbi:hypothetical protein AAFF_G00188600 [Aldrovandia affinis]|uniref:Secreted protein n=1 Tax=Aldrovandia affinis TaxID=143900 RepID=A0AAD7SYA4_9TELE|nr:hypothetical protein AAFF_G00188600 [Aldrovandia affinis]
MCLWKKAAIHPLFLPPLLSISMAPHCQQPRHLRSASAFTGTCRAVYVSCVQTLAGSCSCPCGEKEKDLEGQRLHSCSSFPLISVLIKPYPIYGLSWITSQSWSKCSPEIRCSKPLTCSGRGDFLRACVSRRR